MNEKNLEKRLDPVILYAHQEHLNPQAKSVANDFYEQSKFYSTNLLRRYSSVLKPKGFCDALSLNFDPIRSGRYNAVKQILLERDHPEFMIFAE